MATLKDQLTELESRICTLEHHTGLLRHRQQQEAQRRQAEQEAIRNTAFGGLPNETEALRVMAQVAPHIRAINDVGMVAEAANKAGFKNRGDREFSVQEVREILRRRGFRLPVAGAELKSSDRAVNQAVARDLLLSLPESITGDEMNPEAAIAIEILERRDKCEAEMAVKRRSLPRPTLLQNLPLVRAPSRRQEPAPVPRNDEVGKRARVGIHHLSDFPK